VRKIGLGAQLTLFLRSIWATILIGIFAFANVASAQTGPVPTVLTLSSSQNPSIDTDLVTITAHLTSGAGIPQGWVFFYDGSTELGSVKTTFGEFPWTFSGLSLGVHTITAVFAGDDGQWLASEGSFVQTVERNPALPTTTSLTTSANPAVAGDIVTLTATVTASSGGPTGDVEFYNGPMLLGTGTLDSSGVATSNTVFSDQSAIYLTARYVGLPTEFFESTSEPLEQFVDPRPPQQTVTTLTSSRNPSREQQLVTITAKVTAAEGMPTGYIEFKEDGVTVATAELYDGIATYNTSPPSGSHTITAHYASASSLFEASASEPLTQVVNEFVQQTEPTVTTLTSSPNPANVGELITITATVTAATGVPTGRVRLRDLGPFIYATLDDSGVAKFYFRYLNCCNFRNTTYTAEYIGETEFFGSTSAPLIQYISPGGTTPTETILMASQNPSSLGEGVSFTATVNSTSPEADVVGGDVSFSVDGQVIGQAPLIDGVASIGPTAQFLSDGPHNVRAQYLGSFTFATSRGELLQTVAGDQIPTTTSVTSSSNKFFRGELVPLTATVTPNSGNGTPTGSVEFFQLGTSLGIAALDQSGQAQLRGDAVSLGEIGANDITAVYSGDITFVASTSPVYVVNIALTPTTTTITSSVNPSSNGQIVTLVASVRPFRGFVTSPVYFYDGSTLLGSASLGARGVAEFSTSSLPAGPHTITAEFREDFYFEGSVSTPLNQVVGATESLKQRAILLITSAPNASAAGQSVTFTATVLQAPPAVPSATPTGTVRFSEADVLLGTVTLDSSGVATFVTSALAPGSHPVLGYYSGDANFSGAFELGVHLVNRSGTTTTLVSSLNPSLPDDAVTFTATVTSPTDTPTGTMQFYEGSTMLGTGTLNGSGIATFTTSSLSLGTHPITATYQPAANSIFAASASAPLDQVIKALPETEASARLDDVQEKATGVSANLAAEMIMESVGGEIAAALSGQAQVMSASDGNIGFVYMPGMGKGSIITPVVDVASGETEIASWRIWTSLRYSDFNSTKLEGDQVNALIGTSFLFGNGFTAGLVAGYEKQDYEDDLNTTLKGKGFNIGGYVGGRLGNGLRFDAQVHTSLLDYDLASGSVTGSTDATRLMLSSGIAHTLQFGATTFEPTARLNGTWEWQDDYTDSAAVSHDSRSFNFGRIATGAKIAHRFDLGDGISFSPFLQGFADYRFSAGDATDDSLMDGLSARVGLGAQVNIASGITASMLGELSGLGLENNAMTKSLKAQIAIPF
jgi:Autotransporter beta-domain/Bacterial Ig-like domain (group 3)